MFMHPLQSKLQLLMIYMLIVACFLHQVSSTAITSTLNTPIHQVIRSEYKQIQEKFKENTFLLCSSFGFDVSRKGKDVYREVLGEYCDKVTLQGKFLLNLLALL